MTYYPQQSPIATGLAGRCPRCGQGKLFSGFLKVADRCSVCGLDLSKADSADGPAFFIMLLVPALIIPIAMWVEFSYMPPFWLHGLLWTPLIIGLSVALLRPLKGVMVALQFKHQASDSGTEQYDN